MEEALLNIVVTINSYLSNYVLIILLIGAGLYFTIRTRFVQIRCFGEGWKRVFGGFSLFGKKEKSGMSSFQAGMSQNGAKNMALQGLGAEQILNFFYEGCEICSGQ